MTCIKENWIYKAQHGFRVGRSTVTNPLITHKYVAKWCNSGDKINIESFDLTKAFDRVKHNNLQLSRLK